MEYYKAHQMAVLDLIQIKERQLEAVLEEKNFPYEEYLEMLIIVLSNVGESIFDQKKKNKFNKMLSVLKTYPSQRVDMVNENIFLKPEHKKEYLDQVLSSDLEFAKTIYNNIYQVKG